MYIAHVNYAAKEKHFLPPILRLHDGNAASLPWGNREVIGVAFPREKGTTRSAGYAYVLWRNRDLANRCVNMYHGREYLGKKLDVKISDRDFEVKRRFAGRAETGKPRIYEQVWHFPDDAENED